MCDSLRARARISRLIQRRLLSGHSLYQMQVCGDDQSRVDNFDQRLTSDLQALLDGVCCAMFGNSADYLGMSCAMELGSSARSCIDAWL